jgi:2-polyprenyl-3-methyl-5-hydroxy-6-metoxy-1,4-benzoquinol methylase
MILPERFTSCPLCGSAQLSSLKGYEKDYLSSCLKCHFVFCERKPTADELKAHYGGYPRGNAISEITIKRYEELLVSFEPYRKTNNIIDVGCGDGFFLEVAKRKNWNVFGVEFANEAITICERKGINMTSGPLDVKRYPPDFFDVIASFEVIEHINTPQDEIRSFHTLLRRGGVVYITTPNFNSLSRALLKSKWNVIEYPEHLSYYTPRTLTLLFQGLNFSRLKMSTTGISINRLKASALVSKTDKAETNSDEALRQRVEGNFILKMAKSTINLILDTTGKGDALKAIFQKQ